MLCCACCSVCVRCSCSFRELGLLLNTPRLATCTALGDTMLAKVHKSIFEKVLPALEGLFRKNAKLVYTNGAPLPPGL